MRTVAIVAALALPIALPAPRAALAQPGGPPELVASTGPRTPEAERAGFHLPPGFEAQLVAAEPQIHKPMNLAFDDRGRLWVTSTVEYPYPAKPGSVPRDRVVILDDFAPDGRARKASTFADGLNIPIGVLPLGRGDSALVHAIPSIRRLTDTDGDGKADRSEEMYSSFGFKDTHGMTNAFTWGFDGWIYACHGFANESSVRGADGRPIVMQSGNTYRMKADGSHVEHVTHGQVNPFGLAFDPAGNLYSCDCHSKPIYCLLPGAWYPSFGKPDDGLGFGPEMIKHDHGSTGIAGIVYYAADHFPAAFRDTVFIGNVVTSRINHDRLAWAGASPTAVEQPDFLVSDDPWFRPVDIELGPDGALYVADFYNRIIGHYEVPLTHPGRDRERGRIWRIVYKGGDASSRPLRPGYDLTKMTTEALVGELGDANFARRIKAANGLVERGQGVAESVRPAVDGPSPLRRVHALWVLQRLGLLDGPKLATTAADPDPTVRAHAVKAVGDRPDSTLLTVATRALADPSHQVRRAGAEALGRHPATENIRPLLDAGRAVPADDTHLKQAIRIALRDQLVPERGWDRFLSGLGVDEAGRREIADVAPGVHTPEAAAYLAGHLARTVEPPANRVRYIRHVARFGLDAEQGALGGLLAGEADLATRVAMLKAVQEGEQERGAPMPVGARGLAAETGWLLMLSRDDREFGLGVDLAGALKLDVFRGPLASIAADPAQPRARRETSLASLAAIDARAAVPVARRIVADAAEPASIRERAAAVLVAANGPDAVEALVGALPTAPGKLQSAIAAGLAQTPAGGERLLAAIGSGKASARLLQERGVAVRLGSHNLPGYRGRVDALLKGMPPAEERIQALIQGRRKSFEPSRTDLARGSALFEKNCANCHQMGGKGARVGPQLDGIGVRGVDRLLEDVLDPNRNVDQAFRVTGLSLKDGRVVSGLLLREEGEVLVLADAQGKDVRVSKADVEERSVSQLSPMPANWSDQIPEAEFSDLLAYLLAQKPADASIAKP